MLGVMNESLSHCLFTHIRRCVWKTGERSWRFRHWPVVAACNSPAQLKAANTVTYRK